MSSGRHFPGYVPNPHYTQEDWDEVCDNPELTDEELAEMKPLAVVMPGLVEAIRRSRGEPEPSQDWVWINMDRDLLVHRTKQMVHHLFGASRCTTHELVGRLVQTDESSVWVGPLAALRGTGPGWQDRLNAILREAAERGALEVRPPEAA